MKKLFYSSISGTLAYLSLALPAFAQTGVDPCTAADNNPISAALCGLGGTNAALTIRNIVIFFVVLAVIIALLYLLYGGIKWITSRGDKAEVEGARNHIIAAIVGLILVFLSIFAITIILSLFNIELTELVIPDIIP